jgi:hypothetical protein
MEQPPAAPPARRRPWLPFFAALALLAALAVVVPLLYNLGQQLRPEQLEQARARWRAEGPRDYDLEYTLRQGREEQAERYRVRVRGGRAVFASCDGEVLFLDPSAAAGAGLALVALSAGGGRGYTVEGVFDRIEEVLSQGAGAPRHNFTVAVFDPHDGHPRRFVHRVRGSDEREEWAFRLLPAR